MSHQHALAGSWAKSTFHPRITSRLQCGTVTNSGGGGTYQMVRRVSVTGRERNGEKQRRRTGERWEDEMVTHRALLR